MARDKLSALVITSSVLAVKPIGGALTYACTKTFADFLGQGLNYELQGKVDCLSWLCGEVATKMTGSQAGKGVAVTTE